MAAPGDGLGLLQPMVTDAVTAGGEPRLWIGQALVRGDPPGGRLVPAPSRVEVEQRWDVGPLLAWLADRKGWVLEDTTTLATLGVGGHLAEQPVEGDPPAGRRRIGYAADTPRLWDWPVGAGDASELARVRRPGWDPPEPAADWPSVRHAARRVRTEDPAEVVLGRFLELMGSVLEVTTTLPPPPADGGEDAGAVGAVVAALPGWFREACAPEWWSPEAVARRVAMLDLPGGRRRREAWELRWTEREVARGLVPTERTWRVHSAQVVDEHLLDLACEVPALGSPTTSLKWLLRVCGATSCLSPQESGLRFGLPRR
ncbi:hypothetical protein [Nocardioides sp. AX2bis]|uniref:hypothetical protein n=1 Tax=Nocardioides sp. AX2bis TaxID=2653157 RepID=UPI0012F0F6F1|nr:hypothetical protein [Nocardioides sp. AX2bis]VXC31549.1 hypothetical protein NOCARDAX2BIS_50125 [Nocardioides sp. AX2bis]